jgi:hypothetical protein
MKIAKKNLQRRWLHSHEEDTDEAMVYRPATYDFPPSRGRSGFELRPDGTTAEIGIGSTDRREESPGTWRLEADTLVLGRADDAAGGSRVLKILDIASDRLMVAK